MSKKILTANEINKIIRQEGLCGNNRLPSFSSPRDLNLGGTKAKRSYTPNFNAVRSKDKNNVPVVKNKNDRSSQKPGNRGPKKHSGGVKNNKQGKYVETEGIFSEGMGKAASFPRSYSVKTSSAKDRQNIDALVLPKISSTDFMIKDEDDLELPRNVKYNGDTHLESDDIFRALRVVDPVTYEFNANDKPLVTIKKEECNGDEIRDTHINNKIKSEFQDEEISIPRVTYSAFTATKDKFSDEKPAFSIFKFPDSLLGFSGADQEAHSNLRDLPEGQIGKLIIRKSGKIEMNINNIRHTVTQDLIHGLHYAMLFPGEQSMSSDPSLVTLGTLTEKYTITPDWKEVFQKTDSFNAQ